MPPLIIIYIIITIHNINNIKSWLGYVVCAMYNVQYIVHGVEWGEPGLRWVFGREREREVAYLLFIICNQSIIRNQLSSEN